jgi:hypothetical protein
VQNSGFNTGHFMVSTFGSAMYSYTAEKESTATLALATYYRRQKQKHVFEKVTIIII